jgi:hypothetical protein
MNFFLTCSSQSKLFGVLHAGAWSERTSFKQASPGASLGALLAWALVVAASSPLFSFLER